MAVAIITSMGKNLQTDVPRARLRSFCLRATVLLPLILQLTIATTPTLGAPGVDTDYPLVPIESPGFVQLVACGVVAELVCDEALCEMRVTQTYQLYNRDQVEGERLRLALPETAEHEAPSPGVELLDDGSVAIETDDGQYVLDVPRRALWLGGDRP